VAKARGRNVRLGGYSEYARAKVCAPASRRVARMCSQRSNVLAGWAKLFARSPVVPKNVQTQRWSTTGTGMARARARVAVGNSGAEAVP